jgi:hypothetical protein
MPGTSLAAGQGALAPVGDHVHRVDWRYYGQPRPLRPWYYRGFALRLGWGYPAYGYPWPPPVYVAPPVVAPAPAVVVDAPKVSRAEWIDYCTFKYKSFDPQTGLYTTYSGEKRVCR